MKTPEEKIVKMQELFLEGHSVRFIAENLKMGKTTVRDNIKRLKLERPIDVPPKLYISDEERKRILDMYIKAKEYYENTQTVMKVKPKSKS